MIFFPAHYEPHSSPIKGWQKPIDFNGIKNKPGMCFKKTTLVLSYIYMASFIPQFPQSFSEQSCSFQKAWTEQHDDT